MATPIRAFPWARLALGACAWALLAFLGQLVRGHEPSYAWLVGIALVLFATIGLGVFFSQLGLFARPIVRAQVDAASHNWLALTFDDGPDATSTRLVLDLLEARGHRGTFFVIARKGEAQPELLREIAQRGHALANHSLAHARTTAFLSPPRLAKELDDAEAILTSARTPPVRGRWFRAPVGVVSPRVAQAATRAQLELVSWTRSGRDGTRGATVEGTLARLLPALEPGAILVLHDGAERDDRTPIAPAVLPRLLDELERRGLRSVTLDALLT